MQGGIEVEGPEQLNPQITFIRHVYDTQQAVIRQIDTKAGVFLTLLVFLISGSFPFVKDTCAKVCWSGKGAFTSWLYLGSGIGMIAGFLVTVLLVQQVIRPRSSRYRSVSAGLMFSSDIIRQGDPEIFHKRARESSVNAHLKELTSEVFQLGNIVDEKTKALKLAVWPTVLSFVAWAGNVIAAAYIATWK